MKLKVTVLLFNDGKHKKQHLTLNLKMRRVRFPGEAAEWTEVWFGDRWMLVNTLPSGTSLIMAPYIRLPRLPAPKSKLVVYNPNDFLSLPLKVKVRDYK